ncbi:MAG: hypothetical protein ACLFRG_23735, partial [Desulfococcaceae bacterium]
QRKKGEKKKLQENHFEFLPKFTGECERTAPWSEGRLDRFMVASALFANGRGVRQKRRCFFQTKNRARSRTMPQPIISPMQSRVQKPGDRADDPILAEKFTKWLEGPLSDP